jgi:hypothetical protein
MRAGRALAAVGGSSPLQNCPKAGAWRRVLRPHTPPTQKGLCTRLLYRRCRAPLVEARGCARSSRSSPRNPPGRAGGRDGIGPVRKSDHIADHAAPRRSGRRANLGQQPACPARELLRPSSVQMSMKRRLALAASAVLIQSWILTQSGWAAPGDLDLSFGGNGKVAPIPVRGSAWRQARAARARVRFLPWL